MNARRQPEHRRIELDHTTLKFYYLHEEELRAIADRGVCPPFLCASIECFRSEMPCDTQEVESSNKLVVDECKKAPHIEDVLYSARLTNTKSVHAEVPEASKGSIIKSALLDDIISSCESQYQSAEYKDVMRNRVKRFEPPTPMAALEDVQSTASLTPTLPLQALQDAAAPSAAAGDVRDGPAVPGPAAGGGFDGPEVDDPDLDIEWVARIL